MEFPEVVRLFFYRAFGAGILPPPRGSMGCCCVSVGCAHAFGVRSTRGCGPAIATRFMWVAPTAGGLPPPRLELED